MKILKQIRFQWRALGSSFFLLGSYLMLAISAQGSTTSPLGISIMSPAQLPSSNYSITGLRMNLLVGNHADVYGFDFSGIGNITTRRFGGVQLAGVFNHNEGAATVTAAQLSGAYNYNGGKATIVGLQGALFSNINSAESLLIGLQISALNVSPYTELVGAQLGAYNSAGDVYGVQIGLMNRAKSLHGVQVGLLNINETGLFGVSPIINVGF